MQLMKTSVFTEQRIFLISCGISKAVLLVCIVTCHLNLVFRKKKTLRKNLTYFFFILPLWRHLPIIVLFLNFLQSKGTLMAAVNISGSKIDFFYAIKL